MRLSKEQIARTQEEILSWYQKNARDLPWRPPLLKLRRDGTRDPYAILVSEVMSQQTQLVRVIPKYLEWIKELPTIQDLASAKQSTVLRLWSGLGYNRRALFLQKAAQVIVLKYQSQWPTDATELEKLPGIGKYTASAVACFAFDKQIPVVDTNVRKVILTKFRQNHPEPVEGSIKKERGFRVSARNDKNMINEKEIYEIALQLLPKGRAYEWNQALMDYSALILKEEKIPVPKQSKFVGSKRFYRGKVVKLLVKQQRLTFVQLWNLIQDKNAGDADWFRKILAGLIAEGLIHEKDQEYVL